MKTINSDVKFERFTYNKGWGNVYNRNAKKRKRYEDKRNEKNSERYKESEKDDE